MIDQIMLWKIVLMRVYYIRKDDKENIVSKIIFLYKEVLIEESPSYCEICHSLSMECLLEVVKKKKWMNKIG